MTMLPRLKMAPDANRALYPRGGEESQMNEKKDRQDFAETLQVLFPQPLTERK